MNIEIKSAAWDSNLRVEAYRFRGTRQPFPAHFHEYYVIGLLEEGERRLTCGQQEYLLRPGDLLLFHPGDSHGCEQTDKGTLDYRAVNITKETMLDWTEELTGKRELPGFSANVIRDEEAASCMRALHEGIMRASPEFDREEHLLLLLSLLLQRYGRPFARCFPECGREIALACAFMEQHYREPLSLEQICRHCGLSRSTLLRAFTRLKGVTPYRYLENIRIGEAKKLLEQGASPLDAALATGFCDQSHFTNYFSRFIGLAPGVYRDIFLKKNEEEDTDHV